MVNPANSNENNEAEAQSQPKSSELKKVYHDGIVTNIDGCTLFGRFAEMADEIRKLEAKPGDVWVTTFPKSGTTWMQELAWLLSHDLDFEGAKSVLKFRSPTLEFCCYNHKYLDQGKMTIKQFEEMASASGGRRVLKTHLNWKFLPEQMKDPNGPAKIIYVIRNPKDACISYYYYHFLHKSLISMDGVSLDDFCRIFMSEKIMYGPYWGNVGGAWSSRHQPNVIIVTYEDMKKDLRSVIEKLASFLEVPKPTGDQMEKLLKHLSFESMKNNPYVNAKRISSENVVIPGETEVGHFMRKGIVGDYKQKMSPEMIREFDDWIRENATKIGIPFEHWLN